MTEIEPVENKAAVEEPAHSSVAGVPRLAKFYIVAVGCAGGAGAFLILRGSTPHFTAQFFVYLFVAVASAGMKVTFPGVPGSISVSYVATLLAMLQFEAPETLLIAMAAVAAQTVWHAGLRARPLHLFFNLASISVTVLAATFFYGRPWFPGTPEGQLFRLILAGLVYFFTNTLLVCTVIALTERRSIRAIWTEFYGWSFPFYLVGASLAEMVHLSIARLGWTFTIALLPFVYFIYRSYKLVIGKMEQEKKHAESTAAIHLRTIETLAMAIEAKDECTHDHLRRVQVYSLKTAELLGLAETQLQALQAASILHDIGKLAVPDHILSKPGKLTPEEFERMKIHTIVGARIVEQVRFPYAVAPIVRSHHEKWDGSGYPDGLKAEEIPIGARILSAVDCLDALATDRPYRRALPLDEAMNYVASLAGRSFDPRVVEILKSRYREFEALAQQAPVREGLDTHLVVNRGKAPEAGFQNDHAATDSPLEHAHRFAECVASARHELQTVLELVQEFSGSLRLEETLAIVAERLKWLVPSDAIVIYVREGDVLKAKYANGEGSRIFLSLDIPIGEGISGWVVEQRKPIINGNPSVEPAYLKDPGKFSPLKSALSVPLITEQMSGALTLYRAERDAYSRDDLRLLLAVNGKIARGVERAIRSQESRQQGGVDELTGLPNARSLYLRLEDELARAESHKKRLTVMVCDIDGLKRINEGYGHLAGNQLLKNIARVLRDNCRETDYSARMGGDEFVVLLPGPGPEALDGRRDQIERAVREVCRAICGDETVGLSVGVACYPDNGGDPEALLSEADNQLDQAKRIRNCGSVWKLPRVMQIA